MGWSPYVVGGIASGVGQGINNAVGTIVARRKEEEAMRHQREQEALANRRLDLQEKQNQALVDRSIFDKDVEFTSRYGGIIEDDPTDNGTGSLGMHVGVSTATTQPSEHEGIPMRTVGSFGGKTYKLPADGLTPAERLKQRGRQSRVSQASTAFPYLKLTPGQIAALEDPEMGDTMWQELTRENFELDPRNVQNKASIAGATAAARFPFTKLGQGGGGGEGDGLTPTQRRTQNRLDRGQFITAKRGEQAQLGSIAAAPLPKKTEFGYDDQWLNQNEQGVSPDSVEYANALRSADIGRVQSRMNAGLAGYSADSAARAGQIEARGGDPDAPEHVDSEAVAKIKYAYAIYQQAMAEARTPEAKREATAIYKRIERETLAAAGRRPTMR